MKVEIVSSNVLDVKIPHIRIETVSTKNRQMEIERTMQQTFQRKKISYSIPAWM